MFTAHYRYKGMEVEHYAHRLCDMCIFVVQLLWDKTTAAVHTKHEISESAVLNQTVESLQATRFQPFLAGNGGCTQCTTLKRPVIFFCHSLNNVFLVQTPNIDIVWWEGCEQVV
jgi:hypothetical protein